MTLARVLDFFAWLFGFRHNEPPQSAPQASRYHTLPTTPSALRKNWSGDLLTIQRAEQKRQRRRARNLRNLRRST